MSSKLLVAVLLIGSLFNIGRAQESAKASRTERVAQLALQYFTRKRKINLDDYLKSIRPAGISADQRALVVASIRTSDIVSPSEKRQAKLDALRPILAYHDRAGIEVKVLRLGLAWAGFLDGAAILVSEEAVDILTAEELQAVVAHELGHEYFAAEYEPARNNKEYDKVKEVELRCDAVAIITMKALALNTNSLLSGVSKLTKFNEARGVRTSPDLVTSLVERLRFCEAMTRLAESQR